MSNNTTRRNFIANTAKASVATGLAITLLPSWAKKITNTTITENLFLQKPLPYKYSDLEPIIDALTMEIHYSKHAATYLKNLNEAVATELKLNEKLTLENILKNISKYSVKMRNNAGGHFNHELFWQCMSSTTSTQTISNSLSNALHSSFGSIDNFKVQFADAAKTRFGSGWAWLIVTNNQQLKICSTPNQDNPLMDIAEIKGTPILALDVWEHAYYLKYQNKRPDYINNWMNLINWSYVSQLFDTATI